MLELVGGFFIAASVFVCLGGLYDLHKNGERVTAEGIFKALGIAALFVWIIIGFGVTSWLISVIYVGGAKFPWWVSEKTHIPFLLVLASPILFFIILSIITGWFTNFSDKRTGKNKIITHT